MEMNERLGQPNGQTGLALSMARAKQRGQQINQLANDCHGKLSFWAITTIFHFSSWFKVVAKVRYVCVTSNDKTIVLACVGEE